MSAQARFEEGGLVGVIIYRSPRSKKRIAYSAKSSIRLLIHVLSKGKPEPALLDPLDYSDSVCSTADLRQAV